MSLTQRLSPFTARLAHTMASKKASRVLAAKWAVGQPSLAIYFGGPVGDLYQIEQWLPVFEELLPEFATVVFMKDAVAALHLAKVSRLPIRMAGHADVIEPHVAEWGIQAMFYVNNNLANFSPLRIPAPRHIHLSHGESEKASMTSNQLKAYDYCFVAGQASAARIMATLRHFDESHLSLIGRPQLDQLLNAQPFPHLLGRKTVLYAPTWEGDRPAMAYSSVATSGERWIREILEDPGLRVIYRPHPKIGTRSTTTRRADKGIRALINNAVESDPAAGHIIDLQSDCNPAMASADVAIFDVSAMAMDFSILDRPYFVSNFASSVAKMTDDSFRDTARPLATSNASDVATKIHDALAQGPLPGANEFIRRHFGDTAVGTGSQRFRLAIRAVL